jgi:hypothetical protein
MTAYVNILPTRKREEPVFPTTSDPNRVPEEAGRAEEAKRSGWRD